VTFGSLFSVIKLTAHVGSLEDHRATPAAFSVAPLINRGKLISPLHCRAVTILYTCRSGQAPRATVGWIKAAGIGREKKKPYSGVSAKVSG
jgi:hypothetical protein